MGRPARPADLPPHAVAVQHTDHIIAAEAKRRRLTTSMLKPGETRQAAKIYNDLAEGALVAGLFHSTC